MQTAIIYGAWLGNERGLSLAVDPSMWVGQFHKGLFIPNRCITLNPWYVADSHLRDPNNAERWTMRNLGVCQEGPIDTAVLLLTETVVHHPTRNTLENLGYYLLSEVCNDYSEPFPLQVLDHLKRIDVKPKIGNPT